MGVGGGAARCAPRGPEEAMAGSARPRAAGGRGAGCVRDSGAGPPGFLPGLAGILCGAFVAGFSPLPGREGGFGSRRSGAK